MKNNKIMGYAKGLKRYFIIAIIASIFTAIFNAVTPQIIRIAIDSVIQDVQKVDSAYKLLAMVAVLIFAALLSGLSTYISRVSAAKGSEAFIKRLKDGLYIHMQKLPLEFHVKHQTGDMIQRCTSDTDVIRNFIAVQLMQVFRTLFMVIFALGIMFTMNVKLSLITMIFAPIVAIYSTVFYSSIAKRFLIADEAEGALSSVVQENLTGVRVVRAFGRQRFEMEKFEKANDAFANSWIRLGRITGVYWGVGDLITGIQIAAVATLGIIETVNGVITVGEFLAFIAYNQSLIWPIRSMGRILSDMSKTGVSFKRVQYILDANEEEEEENMKIPSNHDIKFEQVSFSYIQGKEVLKNLNFEIKSGQTVGILGGTGSGKSTLIHLLNRLYELSENQGRITIGKINIKDISRSWLRQQIGMVLQEPFLFSRTIKANIKAADPERSDEDMRACAAIACVDESIMGFAKGYETLVGERGVTLSGGQKQRIAIARMLMQNSPIMIFDDSLSAVDSETDVKIQHALRDELKDRTVIIISHRVSTLMKADQIIVLDEGKLVQMGNHETLMKGKGIYYETYHMQMQTELGKGEVS